MMKRIVCALAVFMAGIVTAVQRPNVLFIFCDDLNMSVEGFGGHPQAKTPNIARLAERGVSFTDAHSNNPVCGPSRASIWNGLYPHTSGYYGYSQNNRKWRDNPVLKENATVFEHFYRNGYHTFATGKVFHNNHCIEGLFKQQDGTIMFGEPLNYGPYPWDGKGRPTKVGHPEMPAPWAAGKFAGFESLCSLADVPVVPPDPDRGIPGYRGWMLNRKTPFHYTDEQHRDKMPDEKSADWAASRLSEQWDSPFFLTVGIIRPHTPFVVPKKYFDRFPLETIQLPAYLKNDQADCGRFIGEMKKIDDWYTRFERLNEGYSGTEGWRRFIQAYLASVAFVDDQVGRILDALDSSAYADNTLVVFSSDHGLHMGQKDMLIKKTLWNPSTQVPLIISVPGNSANGELCDRPVSLIDVYPTLVDLCGLPPKPGVHLDGFSLRPLIENPEQGKWAGPDYVVSSIEGNRPPADGEPELVKDQHFSLRSSDWRYILYNTGEEELYDLNSDPNEWMNLASRPEYDVQKKKLKKLLMQSTGL